MYQNGLYLRPHLVFYPWTVGDRLPEEEMLVSPFASGQLAFQHLCNCHIFLNIWDDIVVPIVKYQVSNSCLSASKFLRLIKGEHLWVVTMMITGNLTNPEEMVARYVRFMFKSDKKGRRKEVDLKENRSSRDGDKVLWERPHITVGETYLASGVETQPDGERIIFFVQIIKMHDLSAVSNLYGKFGFFISTPFSPNFAQSEMPTWNHYYCHCIDDPHVSARQFIEIVNNGRKDDTNLIHISCSSRKFELPNFV